MLLYWLLVLSILMILTCHTLSYMLGRKITYKSILSTIHIKNYLMDQTIKANFRSLDEFGLFPNTIRKYLISENVIAESGIAIDKSDSSNSRIQVNLPRQVKNIHYTPVLPEPVPTPYYVATSKSCAEMLELNEEECHTKSFVEVFTGNKLLNGLNTPYCTVYGCHCYGQWFGQLGDGRAIAIGEVFTSNNNNVVILKNKIININNYQHNDIISKYYFNHILPYEKQQQPQSSSSNHSNNYYGNHIYELQLKGSGRSPYSRGFDGRAVLRSSIREYLVSEAMFHLGVPTTRALSVMGTGITIRRPWYAATSESNLYNNPETQQGMRVGSGRPGKFSPDVILREPGAILCRVAPSFFRFGHMEWFGKRNELKELQQLADYICFREYPHLLPTNEAIIDYNSDITDSMSSNNNFKFPEQLQPGESTRYISLFRCIAQRTSELVAHWLSVGYVQGNMNSDNTLVAGRTIDYGPYGWMEKYDPQYQPFTSDTEGKFAFSNQPNAMSVNVQVLGEHVFKPLVKYATTATIATNKEEVAENNHNQQQLLAIQQSLMNEIQTIAQNEFSIYFHHAYNEIKRKKLGILGNFDVVEDQKLWIELEQLMFNYQCDYTIFFRELNNVAWLAYLTTTNNNNHKIEKSLSILLKSSYLESQDVTSYHDLKGWIEKYHLRILNDHAAVLKDTTMSPQDMDAATTVKIQRKKLQDLMNPKYVLRNWMSTLAYEKAAEGDYSILNEISLLLEHPYEEQSMDLERKYYQKAPDWAIKMPGVAFMS